MPYYATNMIVQHVIRTAKPWGVSGQEILSHVRLSEQESFRPGGMVPSEKMFDALEFAANRSGRPDFGMQLGETIPDGLIAGLAILLSHCKTLGQAADDVGKYFHIVNSAVAIETTTLAHGKKVRFHLLTQGQYELRHVTEMQAVLFRRMGQFLAGGYFAPRIYQLPLAPLSSPQRYEEALGCPVTFNTGECAAFVEQTDVVRPIAMDMGQLHVMLQKAFEEVTRARVQADDGLQTRVASVVRRQLVLGDVSSAAVAGALNMSVRSLQRRLSVEGTSLRAIVNTERGATGELKPVPSKKV